MIKVLKYTEYLYLVVFFFAAHRVYTDWEVDRNSAYLFLLFAIVAIGMFLFRRNYRRKFEQRQRDNKS